KAIVENSVRFNMEADSLNCSILGLDANPGSEEFNLFIKEVAKEMTIKAGQKCTAIRRAIVPEHLTGEVIKALPAGQKGTTTGNPAVEGVRMGPVASMEQVKDVKGKVEELKKACEMVYGNYDSFEVMGADKDKGAFMPSVLLYCKDPFKHLQPH